ncbi:hypothetical protein BT67DRAFT_79555 [Trichocladium antarcticum]|uniref:Uncharacterized protein n=1 Tax=Trichocladium antarcticum TaxID=1450529 RepID=A0AAN6UGW2_9PEZI|nr:hypothetical protein BT67DRAFT_79555 [Trichocladium antarcticum]
MADNHGSRTDRIDENTDEIIVVSQLMKLPKQNDESSPKAIAVGHFPGKQLSHDNNPIKRQPSQSPLSPLLVGLGEVVCMVVWWIGGDYVFIWCREPNWLVAGPSAI